MQHRESLYRVNPRPAPLGQFRIQSGMLNGLHVVAVLDKTDRIVYSTGPCETEQESERLARAWMEKDVPE